jgi:DNA polymerase-3 subunit delta
MFIFIYGEETYLSQLKLVEIINHYKKINQNKANLSYLDLAEDSYNDFVRETTQNSIFRPKKLIIVKNCFLSLDLRKNILAHLHKLKSQQTNLLILFYETDNIDTRNDLFKFLHQEAKTQEIKKLHGEKLKLWLNQEIKKYNLNMSLRTKELLIQFCGNDLWRLANEIKKIALYKYPDKDISENDIKKMIEPIITTDIFKTIDALAIKDKKGALSLIHNHFKKDDEPLYLFGMIVYQFRNLILVKFLQEQAKKSGRFLNIAEIITRTKLHPFVARKTIQQASKFNLEELHKKYQRLFNLDIEMKTGKIEPLAAINSFIVTI